MAINYSYVIVGAGIAGLSFAYKLKQQGIDFLLVEKADCPGGDWQSFNYKNSIYEFGPNSFMNRCPELEEMIDAIGFRDQVLSHSFKNSKRYLYLQNKLKVVGPKELVFSDLLSLAAKLSILSEPFKKNSTATEESIYDFVSRRFNTELAELVSYALQGVWAGDARKLSAKAALTKLWEAEQEHGSIILGLLGNKRNKSLRAKRSNLNTTAQPGLSICSFRDGMQSFSKALVDWFGEKQVCLNADVQKVSKIGDGYQLEINGAKVSAANLVIATKAFSAAELLEPLSVELAQGLNDIYYAPINLYAYTLPKSIFTVKGHEMLDAFGYINGDTKLATLGTIFSSQLFPERALDDEYLFLSFSRSSFEAISSDQTQILQPYVNKKLAAIDFNLVNMKFIERAIPQYNIGYLKTLERINSELANFANLTLIGNYIGGVSLKETVSRSFMLLDQKMGNLSDVNAESLSLQVKRNGVTSGVTLI